MTLKLYFRSIKARENPRLQNLKQRIRHELRRALTDHEERLIELSAAILDSESENEQQPKPPHEAA